MNLTTFEQAHYDIDVTMHVFAKYYITTETHRPTYPIREWAFLLESNKQVKKLKCSHIHTDTATYFAQVICPFCDTQPPNRCCQTIGLCSLITSRQFVSRVQVLITQARPGTEVSFAELNDRVQLPGTQANVQQFDWTQCQHTQVVHNDHLIREINKHDRYSVVHSCRQLRGTD